MAKQLNVNLAFSADTSKVKAQLQDLQNQLNKLTLSSKTELGITKEIEDASRAAAELSVHLKNATNQQTGTLDFSKLNQSIKQSGTSLQQYGRTLQSLGPQGQQAFMSLAQAVANSEVPIRRTNAMLKEMGTTLANTARWQLSSSMLHGFMGAVQSAYGYAQDLNESLNNIRIVTGQNIDQMAKFAEEANKAARALSTTTTEYTNASLIYYQQGLNDQQVKERTDITIKMANVARQSAEVVSDQMTAVWNNFYDGSKSLEHYADVMTALGAATASSTDEIAEGLNKFAAVADTVGLSYEYAASALATVTATTRQSADVVGTAFKTLFARIQDLELGKTLDDGTTLGSYSQALAKVGVQIKDTSGEMKSMDTILEEMAAKWDTLGKAEQIALAQSVAGVRQYTQLIALMDNWDFMKQNLATSNTASGTLQKQADIYAESWEAARDRVTAAAESVYKALLNDDFFIDVLNSIEKIIGFVDHLIDNLGGLQGVLTAIGAIVTKVFAKQLSQGLTNVVYNVKMLTKAGREAEQASRKKIIDDAIASFPQSKEFSTETEKAQQKSMHSQLTLQQEMLANADRMNGYEQSRNQMLLDRNKHLQEQAVLAAQAEDAAIQKRGKAIDTVQTRVAANFGGDQAFQLEILKKITAETGKMKESFKMHNEIDSLFQAFQRGGQKGAEEVKKLQSQIVALKSGNPAVQALIDSMGDYDLTIENVEENITTLKAQIKALVTDSATSLKQTIIPEDQMDEGAAEIDNLVVSIEEQTDAEMRRKAAVQEGAQAHQHAADAIRSSTGAQKQWSDILVESANLAFSAGTALQMLGSAFDTLKNPDVSGWEKFLTVLTTLGMVLPTLVSLFSTLRSLLSAENVAKLVNVAATWGQVAAEKALNQEKNNGRPVTKRSIKETWQDTREKLKNTGTKIKDKFGQVKGKFGQLKNNFNTNAWHKSQGMMQGPGTAQQVSAAGKTAAKGLGGMAASVGFIIAGIAVIATGIKWGIAQATKAEKAVEKAKKKVEELQTNLEAVNSTYSDFMGKVDAFNSASKSLDNLTKGTQEYKQAVYEANQAAMALLETNKNLSYEVIDGRIVIDKHSLDQELTNQRDAMTRAQAAKYAGDAELMRAEENLAKRNLSRELDSKADFGQKAANVAGAAGTGLLGGAGIGAGIGTAVGGWALGMGTVIGTVIGAVVGLIGGIITGVAANNAVGTAVDYEGQALDKIAKAYEQDSSFMAKEGADLEAYFRDELHIDDTDLISSLVHNKDEVKGLAEQMARNAALVDAQNDLIASQLLADNSVVTSSEYQDAIIDKSGDVYDQLLKKALNSKGTQNWGKVGISKATGVNAEAQEVFDDYLRYAGLDGKGYKLVDTTGTDDNREFVYLDETGEEKRVALTTMQYAKATYEATNQIDAVGRDLANAFAEWGSKEDATSQAMLSFLMTDTFEDATEHEYNEIARAVTKAGGVEEYLSGALGDLDAAAEKYGYESAEELINAFTVALANGSTAWSDIDLPNLDDAVKKNMTISTAQQIENLIRVMDAGPIGEEAGKQFSEGLSTMLAGMDTKDQEEALRRIAEIDWSSYDAAYQVKDIIEDLGYQVNMTDAEFEAWNQTMNAANQAYIDYGGLLERLKEIKGIVQDLKVGDIISKDDLERLEKYNKELTKYFRTLGTGQGQLVGDPLDLLQEVNTLEQTELKNAIAETQKALIVAEQRQATNDKAKQYGGADYLSGNATYETTKTETVQNDPNVGHYILGFFSSMGNALANSYSAGYGPYVHDPGIEANAKEWAGTTEKSTTETHVDIEHYRKQLAFLKDYGYDISGFTSADNNPTVENAEAVAQAVSDVLERNKPVSAAELEQLQANVLGSQIDYIMTAQSAEERQEMLDKGEVSENAFGIAAMQAHNEEKWEGFDPKEVEEYADALMDAAENSELLFDNMSEEAAEDVALYTKKMNQGIQKLSDNIEDWSSILDESDSSSEEYAEAMSDMKDAMSDVLGVSEDFLSDDFILQHMEDIRLAAEGDAEAIDRLAIAAGKQILIDLSIQDEAARATVMNLHDQLAADIPEIKVGATVDDADFMAKAAQIVETAGMSVEQANAYFRSLGFEPTFETKKVPVTQELKGVRTTTKIVKWGIGALAGHPEVIEQTSEEVPLGTKTEMMEVPALTTDGGKPNFTLTRTNSGAMNNTSSVNAGGSSGGGGSSKPAEPTKKSDIVERYKEINDKLADQAKVMDEASKAADRLWGPNRIKAMQDANDALEKNIDLLKDKRAEAEYNLQEDKKALKDTILANAGISISDSMFDENGNFTSYDEILNGLYDELHKAENDAGSEWNEREQEKIEGIQDRIDKVKEAISQYDETNELVKDLDTEIQDAIYEWQDNNYEMLNLELEYKVNINDKELGIIDYYLGKMADDLYAYMEAMSQYNQQSAIYTDNLKNQETYYNDLTEAYKAGEISEQAYKEGLANSQSAVISNLQSLEEAKQAMQDYYGNVMNMALEQIAVYTDEMEHLNSVLDHYSSIMELVGKQDDYASKNKILTSKANNIKGEMQVQKELYDKSAAEAEDWAKKMASATEGSNEYETYKKNWQAAQVAANDAQDQMLAKTQEWAEAMKSIIENELAELADTLEKSLTGGVSFDELLTSMERRSSLQEEYLTTTNQIYETNKMMRTAQQEIDKTSNTVAKKKLQNFINETNQLQNQTKLSQYELDIQQAKYDLLLAEIALEEAQQAKSTVRLRRDAEGNFGYVYTADASQVADAEQKLADAQNNLYNIGLEGANNYQQKYAETLQEAQNAITELTQMWMNGEISSEEEFNRRKQEITTHYGEKLKRYSELHTIALSTDSRVLTDAWSSDFIKRTVSVETWKTKVDNYFSEAATSMETWAQVTKEVLANSGLNDMDTTLGEVDEKSKNLIKTLLGEDGKGGVVGAMMSEVEAAGNVSEAHLTIQDSIDTTIEYYENLLTAINNAHTAMTTPVKPAISTEGGSYTPPSGSGSGNGSGSGSGGSGEGPGGGKGYDNQGYSVEVVKKAQQYVGASQDGKWGPDSRAKARAKVGSENIADVLAAMNKSYQPPKTYPTPKTYQAPRTYQATPKYSDSWRYNYQKPRTYGSYDTGGYTGEWGSYGKLAILHEKELVLNKHQTENMLAAMEFLSRITTAIDLQAMNNSLGGLLSSPSLGHVGGESGILEQQVHIEASFPGVSDRNELEEAFNNLINQAAQYANRK